MRILLILNFSVALLFGCAPKALNLMVTERKIYSDSTRQNYWYLKEFNISDYSFEEEMGFHTNTSIYYDRNSRLDTLTSVFHGFDAKEKDDSSSTISKYYKYLIKGDTFQISYLNQGRKEKKLKPANFELINANSKIIPFISNQHKMQLNYPFKKMVLEMKNKNNILNEHYISIPNSSDIFLSEIVFIDRSDSTKVIEEKTHFIDNESDVRTEIHYLNRQLVAKIVKERPSNEGQEWMNRSKELKIYNSRDKEISNSDYHWDSENDTWKEYRRTEYNYSNVNDSIESEVFMREGNNNALFVTGQLTYNYDDKKNLVRKIYNHWQYQDQGVPSTIETTYLFNQYDKLQEERRTSSLKNGDWNEFILKYTYDDKGRVVSKIELARKEKDEAEVIKRVTSYAYSMNSENCIQEKITDGNDKTEKEINYKFDESNNLIFVQVVVDGKEYKTSYKFNFQVLMEYVIAPRDILFDQKYLTKKPFHFAPTEIESIIIEDGKVINQTKFNCIYQEN